MSSLNVREEIRAALTGKTTGFTSIELREATGVTKPNAISYTLHGMVARGEVVKHKGESPNKSRYSLNPEKIGDAPTRGRNAAKKPGRKAGKKRQAREPAEILRLAIDQEFIPALTVDHGLVLVSRGMSPPQFYSPEQTIAIATLLAANFG